MTSVIVDYTFKNVSNFLYSTGGAPKRRGAPGNLPLYAPSRMDWVR